jgi:hypothetical protein
MGTLVTRLLGLHTWISLILLLSSGLMLPSCQSKEAEMKEKKTQAEMDDFRKLSEKLNEDIKYCREAVYKLSVKNSETLDPKRKGEIVTEIKRYAKRIKRNKEQLEEIKMNMMKLQGHGAR